MTFSESGVKKPDLGPECTEGFPKGALNVQVTWERKGKSVPDRRDSVCQRLVARGNIEA